MKLKCPQCSQHFVIAPNAIGPNGRTVRCSACTTTWYVASEPDVLNLQDQIDQEDDIQMDLSGHSVEGAALGGMTAKATKAKGRSGLQTPHAQMRDRAERKKVRRRLMSVAMIWGVTMVIIALMGLALYLMRSTIVEKFPQTRSLYQAVNIKVPIGGLEIYAVQTKYAGPVGEQTIYVEGKIRNVDRKIRDVPLLRLSFKGEQGNVLDQWVVEPSKGQLEAGEHIVFKTHFQNPPIEALSLATNFVFETVEASDANGAENGELSQGVEVPTSIADLDEKPDGELNSEP